MVVHRADELVEAATEFPGVRSPSVTVRLPKDSTPSSTMKLRALGSDAPRLCVKRSRLRSHED